METLSHYKRFAGSAETLAAIQLTSRRDDGRCCAQRSSHPVTSSERRTTSPYEIRTTTDEECMAGRVLKRIARENVNVSLSLPFNSEFAPRSATQSVEKSDTTLSYCSSSTGKTAAPAGAA